MVGRPGGVRPPPRFRGGPLPRSGRVPAGGSCVAPPGCHRPDDASFCVVSTSGGTGRPKGAVRSHRSWLRTFDRSTAELGIGADDDLLLPGSPGHSHFLRGAVHGLHVGGWAHLMPEFAAAEVFDLPTRHPITRPRLVAAMPHTSSGKVDRRALREWVPTSSSLREVL
ncbi:AMP-binding protein [Saccharothrix australiensis]|uniref:AMP-binding protein n=1 Tax=Saccharothrix australiensis TaxID=2072 RepID=UPI002482CCD9|nr:AMP-binding protein [Saccharothrix australiensis]